MNARRSTLAPGVVVQTALWLLAAVAQPAAALPVAGDDIPATIGSVDKSARGMYERGIEALRDNRLDQAAQLFLAASEAAPTEAGPYLAQAEVASRRDDRATIERVLAAGIAALPDHPALHSAWGRYLFSTRRFEEAAAAMAKAAALAPEAAQPIRDLADIQATALKRPDLAEASYRRAIALAPDHAGSRFGLAAALVAQRKYADALDALSGARALDTGNARVPLAIAEVRLAMGQPYEALAAFQEARALQPNLIAAQLGAADVLARIERYDDAIAGYRAVLAIDPAAVPARLGLAGALMLQGDARGAEIEYRGIADANPNQPVALNNLAWFLAQRKRGLDQALVWAKRAVELAPEEPAFRTTLGWVHRQRGELPQAAAELERAVGKQPTAERLYYLGQIQADQGRKDQARQTYEAALRMDVYFEPARKALGR